MCGPLKHSYPHRLLPPFSRNDCFLMPPCPASLFAQFCIAHIKLVVRASVEPWLWISRPCSSLPATASQALETHVLSPPQLPGVQKLSFLKCKQLEGSRRSGEAIRGFLQAMWVCHSLGVCLSIIYIFQLSIVRLSGVGGGGVGGGGVWLLVAGAHKRGDLLTDFRFD